MSRGPERKDDVVARRVAGEALLVPIRDNLSDMQRIFSLNPAAEFIWNRLDGATSADELAAAVCEEFDVDLRRARDDVDAFLADLAANGLVAERGPDS